MNIYRLFVKEEDISYSSILYELYHYYQDDITNEDLEYWIKNSIESIERIQNYEPFEFLLNQIETSNITLRSHVLSL